MCVSPLTIRNPFFSPGSDYYTYTCDGVQFRARKTEYDLLTKNFDDQFIQVGCGSCGECIAKRASNYICRCILEGLRSFVYAGMLSYNNSFLPVVDFHGHQIPYADHKHFRDMVKRIRKNDLLPEFKYFLVNEYGHDGHRPHFHFLLFFPNDGVIDSLDKAKQMEPVIHRVFLENWQVNLGSRKFPEYHDLLTFKQKFVFGKWYRNYDLQLLKALPGREPESIYYYVSKYLAKEDSWLKKLIDSIFDLDGFRSFKRVYLPHVSKSLHLGEDSNEIIRSCIRSLAEDGVSPKMYTSTKKFPMPAQWVQKYLIDNLPELDIVRHQRLKQMVFEQRSQTAVENDKYNRLRVQSALQPDVLDVYDL